MNCPWKTLESKSLHCWWLSLDFRIVCMELFELSLVEGEGKINKVHPIPFYSSLNTSRQALIKCNSSFISTHSLTLA